MLDLRLEAAIDRLRLVIVHNKQRAQDHMVVAAYQDSGWLILDNRTMGSHNRR